MLPSEILFKAAELIEPEGAWTQGNYGRNARGEAVGSMGLGACSWCLAGAIIRVGQGAFDAQAWNYLAPFVGIYPFTPSFGLAVRTLRQSRRRYVAADAHQAPEPR